MITAKELMRTGVPTLSFDDTVPSAIHQLSQAGTSFAVVCASKDRLHGVLSEGNMMRIFLRYKQNPAKEALIFYRELFEPIQLIQEGEVFQEIVKKLMVAVGHRVFVINAKGEAVGYITGKDVLPYLEDNNAAHTRLPEASKADLDQVKSDMYLYESFFSKSPFMMHSVNREGVIQMANETLHSVLGYEYGELIGKTIFDIYPKSSHAAAKESLKKIIDRGFKNVLQASMIAKNGEPVPVEMVSRLLEDQNQNPIGTMTVSRPIDMSLLLTFLP
jgi:PAS domain S-box-containing protein